MDEETQLEHQYKCSTGFGLSEVGSGIAWAGFWLGMAIYWGCFVIANR